MMWATVPLRRIFRIVNGGTPTSDEQYWNGDMHWATPVDIGAVDGKYLTSTGRTLTRAGVEAGSRAVPAGSLLLSTRAPIGYIAQAASEMAFNQGCRGLVATAPIDTRYFRYQLLGLRDELVSRGAGSTFMELSTDALAAVPVAIPPLDEQRRIADFLDAETARIDSLAAMRGRMRNLLNLRRERTVEQVMGLDEYPAMIPLKYAARSVSVGIVITPANWYVDSDGIPALRGINVRPGYIDMSNMVQISHEGHRENAKSRLSAGDVVVVRTGQAGTAAVVPDKLDGSNCIDLLIIRPGAKVDPGFLVHYLNSYYARDKISEHSVGTIQSHFNVASMKDLDFPDTELAEQRRRAAELDDAVSGLDTLNSQIDRQIALLAERRQALITAAVTGQIGV